MSDFKQQVEGAIKDAIHDALPEEIIDLTDRILAAHNAELERIAEEVPPCAFVYDADNVVKTYRHRRR
jgi:hypothetical protein